MIYLIDTHVVLWAAYKRELLSNRALEVLESDSEIIMVSAVSAWEIATKFRLGKLPNARKLVTVAQADVARHTRQLAQVED